VKIENTNEIFMQRCIELASNGKGKVAPNPMVGAVIVHNNIIIGEGLHKAFGQAHAEVNAIRSVKDKTLLQNSTLYVNLEPCSHLGKTPPCSDFINENNIPRVVIGTIDPNSFVSGKGIEKLRNHRVDVLVGILEKECRSLNRRFFTFHTQKRPYIILKWAQTRDGFIDKIRKPNEPIGINWISNQLSRVLVHKWRTQEQGLLVGTNTVLQDNPKLNVRYWEGRSPLRIILDRDLRIPKTAFVLDNTSPTLVLNEFKSEKNKKTEFCKLEFCNNELDLLVEELYNRQLLSVIVEGGKEVLESFIHQNLWDEARVFIGDKSFGNGIKAPLLTIKPEEYKILNDRLLIYNNTN
jgi:diaminohydroxyphosphoribosylaminopyrimidine deaminase/5-amino-6-(5-phosphoribosylamino)uracil reductase